jgi:hypothetical protein
MDRNLKAVSDRFAEDIKNHKLSVLTDNGVNRCLLFKRPDSSNYAFFITTWPGHLCISGDMGCTVFQRLQDMFEFFRGERVNLGYWAQKIVSNSEFGRGSVAWDSDAAEDVIMRMFNHWKEERLGDLAAEVEELNECIAEIELCIKDDPDYDKTQAESEISEIKGKITAAENAINCVIETELEKIKDELISNANSAYELSRAYENYENSDNGVDFSDLCEYFSNCKVYTHQFIWQCHAIVWAIKQYDELTGGEK